MLTQVTTLPNGLRVASDSTPGHFSAAGVYVDAGSRYERLWVPGESGVSHMTDRMAFKATANRSAEEMVKAIDAVGSNVMCTSARESILYQASFFSEHLKPVLSIFAETLLHPLLDEEELLMMKDAVTWEVSECTSKPELNLPEVLHAVAYKNNTLGNPLLAPPESVEKMTAENLREFRRLWYSPERIVVAGAGMEHNVLVDEVQKLFGDMPSRPVSDTGSVSSTSSVSSSTSYAPDSLFDDAPAGSPSGWNQLAAEKARYTGGELFVEDPASEFTHVYVGFEGVNVHDPDLYALATLQVLLGGGGSFSAGGPGKGMYSRLYTHVLNRFHAVEHCSAFHHCYNDSGLFGIAASVHPSFVNSIGYVIAQELIKCTAPMEYQGGVTETELARARNQLKSSLVMSLESRLVQVEDLGRQLLADNKRTSVEEMCAEIDKVDLRTLHRVATRVLCGDNQVIRQGFNHGLGSGQTTVVVQGKTDGLRDLRNFLYLHGLGASPHS